MASTVQYDPEKFQELLLYIADRMGDDPSFGATVLNKALFFSDFLAYRTLGHSITGAEYQKLEYGPAPRSLLREQQALIDSGRAVLQSRNRWGRIQRRLVVLDQPRIDGVFKPSEIELVDRVIEMLRGHSATAVSQFSHAVSVGWRAADVYETIPYGTAFLSPPAQPTPRQIRRARELVGERDSGELQPSS